MVDINGKFGHYATSDELYQQAIELYGSKHQQLLAVKEMSELTKEIGMHINRGGYNFSAIIEEIADVEIMIEQMRLMFGGEYIDKVKRQHLERLADRIYKEQNNE